MAGASARVSPASLAAIGKALIMALLVDPGCALEALLAEQPLQRVMQESFVRSPHRRTHPPPILAATSRTKKRPTPTIARLGDLLEGGRSDQAPRNNACQKRRPTGK